MNDKAILVFITLSILAGTFLMTTSTKRGIRNNNPLNIKQGDNWVGQVGLDGPFIVFDHYKYGLRAAGRILRTYAQRYNIRTIEGIISRWAPSSENDTQGYIHYVSNSTGIDKNKPLEQGDYVHVLAAMVYMENGQQPYTMDEIKQGFEWGFYG